MSSVISAPASTQMMASRSRVNFPLRAFRTLHLWFGLSLGLLLALQGVTGAVLVWRPDLDRLFVPHVAFRPSEVGSSAIDSYSTLETEFRAAKAAVPASVVRGVRLAVPRTGTGADEWMVQRAESPSVAATKAGQRFTVYTSPATGALVAVRGRQKDILQFLVELHHNLLLGALGRKILGVLAVATVLMALSGLWLWWPAHWVASRFRPRAAARPLHYSLGFWTMWPLLAIAVSAMYFVWRQPVQHLFRIPTPNRTLVSPRHASPNNQVRRPPAGQESSELQGDHSDLVDVLTAAQHAAQAAIPGARVTLMRFPEQQRGPYIVFFAKSGDHFRAAPNSLAVQRTAGGAHVVQVSLWHDLPRRQRFLEWLPRVHQAEFGGWPVKLVWSITGLMPTVLYVSGFLMWRRRLNANRRFPRRVA